MENRIVEAIEELEKEQTLSLGDVVHYNPETEEICVRQHACLDHTWISIPLRYAGDDGEIDIERAVGSALNFGHV